MNTRQYAIEFEMTEVLDECLKEMDQIFDKAGLVRRNPHASSCSYGFATYYPKNGVVVSPVMCMLAVQECARSLEWFPRVIINAIMMRIEEVTDLSELLKEVPQVKVVLEDWDA